MCLGGLRCGLMPAIGGGLPQLCVSRISGRERREERRGDGKGPDTEFWKEGDILRLKDNPLTLNERNCQ